MWVKVKKRKLLLELKVQLKVRLTKILCVGMYQCSLEQSPEGVLSPMLGSLENLPLWDDSLIFDPQSPLGVPFHLCNASIT